MNYCKNCGKNIEDGVNFCTYCGSPVNSSYSKNVSPEQEKSLKGFALGFVLSFFLALIGFVLGYCLGDEECKKGSIYGFVTNLLISAISMIYVVTRIFRYGF